MKKRPPFNIKTTRPDPSGLFPRKRLFRKLDQVRKRPIVWITGPPGCGKTALVASYLEQRKIPCVWYQVGRGDADLGAFFRSLSLAVHSGVPGKKKSLPRFPREAEISRFAGAYFEELYARMGSPSVLVFDNFERSSARSTFVEVIREGFVRLPRGVNVLVLSRSGPPPALARQRASNRMGFIGWKDLRMTLEETEGLAATCEERKLSRDGVEYLLARTEGWAAGVVLLLAGAGADGIEPKGLETRTPQLVFDYFASELYDRMGARTRRFLLRTAFLPSLTATMEQRLTGNASAARILSYLDHHHVFIEPVPGGATSFRYHALFREFLLSRAKRECAPEELSGIRRAAAAILEESGQIEEAVALLRENGEWDEFARVIRVHGPGLVRMGRCRSLREWTEDLPKETMEKRPWLSYWMGICRLPFAPEESRALFEDASHVFRQRGDPEGEFRSWVGVAEAIICGPGTLKALDPWFATLEELLQRHPTFPSVETEARVTGTVLKASALRRPHSMDMNSWAERAAALVRSTEDGPLKFLLLLNMASGCFHAGDLLSFAHHLESLRALSANREITPLSHLELFWLEAAHANLIGEHRRCRKIVAEGLALSEETGIHLKDFLLMGHGVLGSLHLRDLPEAQDLLRRMASALPQAAQWEAGVYHFVASEEALHRDDEAHAQFHADRCLTMFTEVGNPWTEVLARLQSAFVLDLCGKAADADRHLERVFRIGVERRMDFARFVALLARAHLRLRTGERDDGLVFLRDGLRFGREKGFVDTYVWRPGLLETIASEALEHGIETEYVRDMVRKNSLLPDGAVHYTERWPWALKIFTMGRFTLVRDGEPVSYSRRAQQKPLQMLKALIAMGGRNVSKEHLTEILWADADGDMAHHSFAMTLGRLRKLLGYEKAVVLSDGRLNLCNRHCWVDVWALERILGQAESVKGEGPLGKRDEEHARLVEKAIAVYKGPFLEGETFCSQIETSRERLRSKFLRFVEAAGRRAEGRGQLETALSWYRKALEVDNLAEAIYRRKMICHRQLGRTAEGLATYRRCRKILAAVLGVEPSSETEAIRRSLLTR